MSPSYLSWLASESGSHWNNDSALFDQVRHAEKNGAIGVTTNPPLSFEALSAEKDVYTRLPDKALADDEFAFKSMSLVVKRLSDHFLPLHEARGTYYGCVRAQVAPNQSRDAAAMLASGKALAAINRNVMVKIPGTRAGFQTLEDLAALGIPTNPTVITTVSQAVFAAEAFERGAARAAQTGLKPAWSTCAVVMGRAQDYFAALNKERGLGLATGDLEWAALAVVKRCNEIFRQRGFKTLLMPAAYRCAMQVEQLAGGDFHSTIHPKIQKQVEEADAAGTMRREKFVDAPVDAGAIGRVAAAMPEFVASLEPGAIALDKVDDFGSVVMTLGGFDAAWRQLYTLKTVSKG